MTNTKKLTKKDKFNALATMLNSVDPTNVVANGITASERAEFISHEIDLLENRKQGDRQPTAQQTANESIKQVILDNMTENRLYTITEMCKEFPECADLSNQRMSAILKQMYDCENPTIKKIVDKRKTYFQLV
jgi:hypothetical protein